MQRKKKQHFTQVDKHKNQEYLSLTLLPEGVLINLSMRAHTRPGF